MRDALLRLQAGPDVAVNPPETIPETSQKIVNIYKDIVLTATKKVNVYQVPPTGILGNNDGNSDKLKLVLDRGTQTDPIFVFRTNPPSG
jgi:hypothetical protein